MWCEHFCQVSVYIYFRSKVLDAGPNCFFRDIIKKLFAQQINLFCPRRIHSQNFPQNLGTIT